METNQRPAALLDESQPAKAPSTATTFHQQQQQQQQQQPQHQLQQQLHVAGVEAKAPAANPQARPPAVLQASQQQQQQHPAAGAVAGVDAAQQAPAPPVVQYQALNNPQAQPALPAPTAVPPLPSPPPAAELQHAAVPPAGLQHAAVPAAGLQHAAVPPAGLQHTAVPAAGLQHAAVPPAGLQHTAVPPAGLQHTAVPPAGSQHATQHAAVPPQSSSPPPPANLQNVNAPSGAELEQHVRDLVSSVVNRATEPNEKPLGRVPAVARKPTFPEPNAAAAPAAQPSLPGAAVAAESSHLLSLLQRGFVDFCDVISHPERWDTALAKRTWRRVSPVLATAARLLYQAVMFVAIWAAVVLTWAARKARPVIATQWRRRRANSARLRSVELRLSQWMAKLRAAAAPHDSKLDALIATAKRAGRAARRAADDFYVATAVPASHRYHLGTSLETARAASPTSAHAPGVVDALVERAQVAHDAACAGLVGAVGWSGRASRDAALRYERCARKWENAVASKLQRATPEAEEKKNY